MEISAAHEKFEKIKFVFNFWPLLRPVIIRLVGRISKSACGKYGRSLSPQNPKGPKIEKNQSRLKISISIEHFNLDLQNCPQK